MCTHQKCLNRTENRKKKKEITAGNKICIFIYIIYNYYINTYSFNRALSLRSFFVNNR